MDQQHKSDREAKRRENVQGRAVGEDEGLLLPTPWIRTTSVSCRQRTTSANRYHRVLTTAELLILIGLLAWCQTRQADLHLVADPTLQEVVSVCWHGMQLS